MDAMQKRKMWKVAATHFVLTIILGFGLFFGVPSWQESLEGYFVKYACFILQPQFYILTIFHVPDWLWKTIWIGSIPIWIFCFSWLFVKLDNWLNHFPVLGKRVF
jgi:hypothetical protein